MWRLPGFATRPIGERGTVANEVPTEPLVAVAGLTGGVLYSWLLVVGAILLLILIPFAPQLVRLRIRTLKWLQWNWAVRTHENHFPAWVLFFRIMLFVVAAVMLYFGWTQ